MSTFENIAEELKKAASAAGVVTGRPCPQHRSKFRHRQPLGKRQNQTVPPRSRKNQTSCKYREINHDT